MEGLEVIPANGNFGKLAFISENKELFRETLPLDLLERIDKLVFDTRSPSKQERQFEQVMGDMQSLCDFVTVSSLANSQLGMWFHVKDSPHKVFKPFREATAMPLIYQMFKKNKYSATAQRAKSVYDTLKIAPATQYKTVPQEVIRVSRDLYWDTENAELLSEEAQHKPCFRELFDSSGQTSVNVPIDAVHFDWLTVDIYTRLLIEHNGLLPDPITIARSELEPNRDDFASDDDFLMNGPMIAARAQNGFEEAIKPFAVWATENGALSVDTLNDLLKIFAVPFLKTPPKWFVYYIGDTRNGKSSCIKCQRVLMGMDNTSGLAMPQLFDPHNANHVLTTMLNAADEDYDFAPSEMQQGLTNFKKAATHDEIDLPMFYSQDSTTMTPMFLSIFSRNSLPDFGEGDGAQAVTKRMRAVFFKNDLSKFDSNGHDFEKETYTPQYFSKLLPLILAYARYYNNRTIDLSETCRMNSGLVEAVSDPATYFFNELCYWFDYTERGDFVIMQAKRFFQENGIQYSGEILSAVKKKIAQCEVKRVRSPYLGGPDRTRLAALPNRAKRNRLPALAQDAIYSVYGNMTFDQWHRRENKEISNMSNGDKQAVLDPVQAPSIFALLRDLEDDGLNPVEMQRYLDEKERKIASASIDDAGNLVDDKGNILNGLL